MLVELKTFVPNLSSVRVFVVRVRAVRMSLSVLLYQSDISNKEIRLLCI